MNCFLLVELFIPFLPSPSTRPISTGLFTSAPSTFKPHTPSKIIAKPSICLRPIFQAQPYSFISDILARRRRTALKTGNRIRIQRSSYVRERDVFNLQLRRVAITYYAAKRYALCDADGIGSGAVERGVCFAR